MVAETHVVEKNRWFPESASGGESLKMAKPSGVTQDGYYGVPMLKRPLWKWEIAFYFFFEGVSAGSYLLGTLAETFGKDRYPEMTRAARYISLAALLPCPPLLIADLGRPERFHHMLRVWKPKSPMNLGAWALSGYSLPAGLLALKQLTGDVQAMPAPLKKGAALMPSRVLGALGIPFAFVMLSYPGVLLSTTSTPVWSRTRFLGALIAASSMSTAAAALSLVLASSGHDNRRALERLEKIENFAGICEGAALAAYIATSGETTEPLVSGPYARHLWLGAVSAGLVMPALARAFSSRKDGKKNRLSTIFSSALTLAGGLALKWALTHAGRVSAESAVAARDTTKPPSRIR
jgi:formate-dependent nitrite reductase membrane component NrfD